MNHRHGQRKKMELELIVTNREYGQCSAETENISLDGLFIKSPPAARQKKNTSIELTVTFTHNNRQTHHTVSAFVIRHSQKGYAVIFSEYDRTFITAIRQALATPALTSGKVIPLPASIQNKSAA